MADADKALGEQMQEEATQEFIECQGHQFLLVIVSRVSPTKSYLAVVEGNQSMVGDRHAVGVTAEILQYILGTAEGWFGVDDPVFSEQWPEPGSEGLGLSEQCQIAGKVKLAMRKGRLESVDELAAKDASEHRDREKESGM